MFEPDRQLFLQQDILIGADCSTIVVFLERDERVLRDMGVKGAFLGAEIPAGSPQLIQGVVIAGEALRSDADSDYVWIVHRGAAERRAVRISGPRDRAQVLVTDGLNVGEIIVRSSEKPLVDGQAIKTDQ